MKKKIILFRVLFTSLGVAGCYYGLMVKNYAGIMLLVFMVAFLNLIIGDDYYLIGDEL